jgi:hypothetical protein
MKRVNESLVMAATALVALSGCAEETFAFGEPRCRYVSCAPQELGEPANLMTGAAERTPREEVAMATVSPTPCPIEGRCVNAGPPAMRLLTRADQTSALVAGPFYGFREDSDRPWADGTGVWVGRYQNGSWHGSTLIRYGGPITNPHEARVAIATDAEAKGEALIAVSELQRTDEAERRLRVFRFNEHDALQLQFEDAHAASLTDAVMLEGDLLVAGVVQSNFELTRYGTDGTIRWRQTALASSNRLSSLTNPHEVQIGVLDEDRIAVLVPYGTNAFEVVVLDGSGEKLSSYPTRVQSDLGARLAIASSGEVVVAKGGYAVEWVEIDARPTVGVLSGRDHDQFYELIVFGFDVAVSGWAYVSTRDGTRTMPVDLIERLSPDGELIDGIALGSDDSEACSGLVGTLRVDADEQTAFIATSRCIAEIPLPPLLE